MTFKTSDENELIAKTCGEQKAACCRQGKIFLSPGDYEKLVAWVARYSPDERNEFNARIETYDDFYLYDQKTACQFLDEASLCRLHASQTKPTECFWWPLHVYANPEEGLQIKAAAYCCDAACKMPQNTSHVTLIESQAREIGLDRLRSFRNIYPGRSNDKVWIKTISDV